MFRSKTLFIVGAGASDEAGLPTGHELKNKIAEVLNFYFEHFEQKSGSYQIIDALRKVGSQVDIGPYIEAAWKIRAAMPQAISIDNYLDAHKDDPFIQLSGKLAIVEAILNAERASKLAFNRRERETIDPVPLQQTWYAAFFKLLTESVRKTDVRSVFNNVSFLTFNYDRCIEHFLLHAIRDYYSLHNDEALNCIEALTVSHPFGLVGRLRPGKEARAVPFGGIRDADLFQISKQIKTFTERIEDEAALVDIRDRVRSSETIVFLGFAFHEMNMELLRPEGQCAAKRVFATAKGISDNDCTVVRNDILRMLNRKSQHVAIEIRNDLTCCRLFEEYWRVLSR